jgi:hypothetical protein
MQKLQMIFPETDTKDKKILIFTEAKDTLDYLEEFDPGAILSILYTVG